MAPANEGRQSPDPEHQTGDQQSKPPAENPNQGSSDHAQEESKATLDKLPSNPEHILKKHAEETTSKQ